MSHGWSQNDKAVAKVAVERARRRAEQEAMQLHQNYKVENIDDLWRLELRIGVVGYKIGWCGFAIGIFGSILGWGIRPPKD
jgi:hypothetical protein